MFEGLNAIPWYDLRHAYGSAEEVPMWLRQLASDDVDVREEAFDNLGGSLCHQGWICPATAYAVPYLVELMQMPTLSGRDNILSLLDDIAAAPPLDEETWRTNPEVPVWEVPASIPFKDAHAAVEAGIPVYVALLDDPELPVRQWAAKILGRFDGHAPEVWPVLRAALEREPTEPGQANLLLALGYLAEPAPEQRAFFLEQFQAVQGELSMFAAALVLTRLAREETPEGVAQVLEQAMLHPSAALQVYSALACGGGSARSAARWTLFYLGSARLQSLVPLLEEQLVSASAEDPHDAVSDVQGLAELLVFIVFGDQPETGRKRRPVATLNEQQRSTLLLLEREQVWYSSNLRDLLAGHRLPETREQMAAYLGRELPAPALPEAEVAPPATADSMSRFTIYRAAIQGTYPMLRMGMMQGRWATEAGADDVVIIDDGKALFRFPIQAESIETLEREGALLHTLQDRLPLPIPNPAYTSQGTHDVGQVFLGYRMLPGKALAKELLESVDGEEAVQHLADQLASFLFTLHTIPIAQLVSVALPEAPKREGLEAFAVTPALLHGSFGPRALLYDAKARAISGVISFHRACLGDPALDFAGLLGPGGYGEDFVRRFAPAYPGLAAVLERARFYVAAQRPEKQSRG